MEDKHTKFIRLAESRTNDILNRFRLIGNLANRSNYDYTQEEVDELFSAIELELKKTRKLFNAELHKHEASFKFSKKDNGTKE